MEKAKNGRQTYNSLAPSDDGGTMLSSTDTEKDNKVDFDELKMVQSLQDSLDVSHMNLDMYSVEQCEQEIQRCTVMNLHYRRLMYLIAINSGMHYYSQNINYYLISDLMKRQSSDWTIFTAFTGLAWTIKPVYGWITDSIYPFKYRFKPYVSLMSCLYLLVAVYVALHTFSFQEETDAFNFNIFKVTVLLLNIFVAFIDSLAQGLTVVTTKIDLKISKLRQRRATMQGTDFMDDNNSMKSYGLFNMLRGLLRCVTALIGGIFAKSFSVGVSYTFLCFYPTFMIIFTLFFFKETSKRKWFNSLKLVLKGLRYLSKLIVKPFILLPLIYMLINFILPPDYSGVIQYMLTKKIGVSIKELAIVDNVAGIAYYFAFLWVLPKIKNVPLWKLFVFGNLARIAGMVQITVFYDFSFYIQIISRFVFYLISRLTSDFFLVPLVARISKHLPEGFESTGVVVIVSLLNFSSIFGSTLGSKQQKSYHIKNGYYERGLEMFTINQLIAVGLVVAAPLFLAWG